MTATPQAHEAMISAAKGLAYTAVDIINRPELLKKAEDEHQGRLREQG